jgi:hypothetical protein
MNHRTCQERPTPPPSGDLEVGAWVLATVAYVFSGEPPCGKPATHIAFGSKPLCEAHAEALRVRLREGYTVASLLKAVAEGHTERRMTEADIARLVRPIEAVS